MEIQITKHCYLPPKVQTVEFLVEGGFNSFARLSLFVEGGFNSFARLSLLDLEDSGTGESYVESANSGEGFFGGTGNYGTGTESYQTDYNNPWQW